MDEVSQRKRNMAIAIALDALGTDTGPPRGLSPVQQKILRTLMHGEELGADTWQDWGLAWPHLRTVILPTMKARGLIYETREHPARPSSRALPPIHHNDIAITEIGMLVLHRFEQKSRERIARAKPWLR